VSDTLPDNTGYVAAAYLVFLALVLIYVAIMAAKLGRVQRELQELDELAARQEAEREEASCDERAAGPGHLPQERPGRAP
jgi:uncharacterized membrane protein